MPATIGNKRQLSQQYGNTFQVRCLTTAGREWEVQRPAGSGVIRGHVGAPGNWRVPKVEVVGRSVEGMDEMFWATITQFRTDLAGVSRK